MRSADLLKTKPLKNTCHLAHAHLTLLKEARHAGYELQRT